MKNLLRICTLLFISVSLFACTSETINEKANLAINENTNVQVCKNTEVQISANFPTGRMDECKALENNEFIITLIPENTPINSSPWYAFKVEAKKETTINITMLVQNDKHRYPPKISHDGKTWFLQPHEITNGQLTMTIAASSKPTYIAAQEIINNLYYVDWAKRLLNSNDLNNSNLNNHVLGQSTQNRPIHAIERRSDNESNNEWLVVLGRQHPPEITGALALFPFVETLLSNSELSKSYLNKYNILVIPNINPDGVHLGNWRHNANGVDLNRDWQNFSQVETQQINKYLEQLVDEGQKITFAIDFHSTKHDVFYVMPVDYGVENPYFVQHWLAALNTAMPNFDVVIKPGNTPNNGVSKQYFADKFGVHAITYEMGDDTDRQEIIRIANKAANTLMTTMLSDANHNEK